MLSWKSDSALCDDLVCGCLFGACSYPILQVIPTNRKQAACNPCNAHGCLLSGLQQMVEERGGHLYSTDDRYCIDNGAMIAWPGLLAFKHGQVARLEDTTCTQRYRTDDVLVTWRD